MSNSNDKLSLEQAQARLHACAGWRLSAECGGLLHRHYTFRDFAQAFHFMSKMAQWSEAVQHHPEWRNVYSRVEVSLTTHDVGGLSEKDFAWAQQADQVARALIQDQSGSASWPGTE